MALVFERFLTKGLGDLSYLIGDDADGSAAVIDPRADIDAYVSAARRHSVAITKILQTHVHEDFMTGALELAARTGAVNLMSHEGGEATYGFEHEPLRDGDVVVLGDVVLGARHTPGHTPEHLSFLISKADRPGSPHAVLSGGSLLAGSAGRADLLGPEETERMVKELHATLFGFFMELDDSVLVHPTHAHGSPCGADIGDRLETTIGWERRHNGHLQARTFEEFRERALADLPEKPTYYPRLKDTNTKGPEVLRNLPVAPQLPPKSFSDAVDAGRFQLLDTRSMLAFGGAHVPGAINIGALPELSIWAGWMLDASLPILLVVEDDRSIDRVLRLLVRTGFTRFAGYLAGGMKAWASSGAALGIVPQVSAHEVRDRLRDFQIVDVRTQGEWDDGRIPHARHVFLPDLPGRMRELDRDLPSVTYCDSGYRASVAASLMKREGFDVRNMPGSWQAWCQNQFPVEK